MVDAQQHHRLHKLGLDGRTTHRDNRFARKNRRTFRYSPNIAGKPEISQIIKKLVAENVSGLEIFHVLFRKTQTFQIVYQLLHTGHDGKPAVIRHPAEKHIEITSGILKTTEKIAIGHGQLIKIRKHGEFTF